MYRQELEKVRTEVIGMKTMKKEHSHFPTWDEVGICSACDDYPICKLHRKNEKPVLFCEEFRVAASTPRQEEINPSSSDADGAQTVVEKREDSRSSYFGLCRSCKKLLTCTFTKPGGGTWHCSAYEEME